MKRLDRARPERGPPSDERGESGSSCLALGRREVRDETRVNTNVFTSRLGVGAGVTDFGGVRARSSDADSSTERGNSDSGSDAGCCEQSDASSSHNADW